MTASSSRPKEAAKFGHPLSRPDLAERGGQIWPSSLPARSGQERRSGRKRGAGEADRKSGWSVVVDDDDGSVGGRWLALAATGHAAAMVGDGK
ncbi:hypothetical protein Scep_000322 [Stephania cephalantha]|uniref:Uncharacterized protein n=1 Tax=Stephania cephalantha TaxID=152367 RepID=A0AAP0Q6K1_9MAGN